MIKEIDARWDAIVVQGMAGDDKDSVCAVAEMKVEKDGQEQYLTIEWTEAAPDKLVFEVTDKPILDMLTFQSGSPDELQEIRDNAPEQAYFLSFIPYEGAYDEQYRKLRELIKDVIVKKSSYDPEEHGGWAF